VAIVHLLPQQKGSSPERIQSDLMCQSLHARSRVADDYLAGIVFMTWTTEKLPKLPLSVMLLFNELDLCPEL
jgi:hypothetical protein